MRPINRAQVTALRRVALSTLAPIVFNAPVSAKAGDLVTLQGARFGSAPQVYLGSTALTVVNKIANLSATVQIPSGTTGAIGLRVVNGSSSGATVWLNKAVPHHLDATKLSPSGAFRIFGRSLLVSGFTPTVKLNGSSATVNTGSSNEHMLVCTAPTGISGSLGIVVDNGNGSGPTTLNRTVGTYTDGTGDVFTLGVGWGAGFSAISSNVVSPTLAANGTTDDTAAINAAIATAAAAGGGVVQLPSGTIRIASSLNLASKVIVSGNGLSLTTLNYESNYPIYAQSLDRTGLRNLTLTRTGSPVEAMLLKDNTRLVLQNCKFNVTASNQMFLTGNKDVAVINCQFSQTTSNNNNSTYNFSNGAGIVFSGNTSSWRFGACDFGRVHDSYIVGNTFVRDGTHQSDSGTVHGVTVNFAYRVAVVGNTFTIAGGPITNHTRNDGETILTEGGGSARTENLGTVESATATTLTDTSNTLNVDPFSEGSIPENYAVSIVAGTGAGQSRYVTAYSAKTITVDRAWDITPDSTSKYATFVYGLSNSLIKGNSLTQCPRGIWLYQCAVRDVDVISNTTSEGGGIYLRSYQSLTSKYFMPIWNVRIANNTVGNSTSNWASHINAIFVNADAAPFGISNLGIEIRDNQVTANNPNYNPPNEEYANTEGIYVMMRIESSNAYVAPDVPRLLGTVIQHNTIVNASPAIALGTGAGATTTIGNIFTNSAVQFDDWGNVAGNSSIKSTDTVNL